MPTYTYRCQKCGDEFERFQAMADPPVKRCPSCKGKVQRVFHPVGIVLKGSGFHKTDYRSESKKSAESRAEATKSESESRSESTSTEKKRPETKSDTSDTKSSEKKRPESSSD